MRTLGTMEAAAAAGAMTAQAVQSSMRVILMPLMAAFLLLSHTGAALADPTREQVMGGAARCDLIPDNRTWLDCFYGSAQPMRAQLGLPAAPPGQVFLVPRDNGQARPAAPPPVAAAAPQSDTDSVLSGVFGSVKYGNQHLRDYSFNRNGSFVVTLANGQVWRQDGDPESTDRAKWDKPAGSYVVDIYSTFAGYNLRVRGDAHSYKVHPVKS